VVGFNLRWHRLVQRACKFIQTGILGRIKAINSVYTHYRLGENAPDWHRKRKLGGGVSFNEAVHHFDLWRYLIKSEVEQVFSFTRSSSYYEDETHVTSACLSNGALATGVFTFKTSPTSEVDIYGENGRLHLSLYRFDGFEFFVPDIYPGNITDRLKKSMRVMLQLPQALPIMRRGGDFAATFYGLWQHFIHCINRDETSECTLEDGKHALQVSLATIESTFSGQPVQIRSGD
jgi:predicted dehydrogenase